jgi:hypothetical protein
LRLLNLKIMRKTLKSLQKLEIDFDSRMKFKSSDLIQIKGYSNSMQGFDLKDFSNLERCKTIPKIGMWKFGHRIQIQMFGFKSRIL